MFSERDCEASSLPNPLEADFRRCSLLLPMLSSIPNLLEMLLTCIAMLLNC